MKRTTLDRQRTDLWDANTDYQDRTQYIFG